ncbi:MAG: toprim domain-containing protein, partial [Rhodospirillaceae bacterium]|nr:toprim domain-containing protein [Rhodospirillaceae bacterium]
GTALTEDQIRLIWRVADEPVLCFDGDTAGERAALRAAERALPLLQPGKTLRFMALPSGDDPDTLIKARGAEGFRTLLAGAHQLVDVLWQSEVSAASHDTPERRADLERRINARLAQIEDPGVKYHYQQSMRQRLRDLFFVARPAKGGNQRGRGRFDGPKRPELAPGLGARGDIGAMKAQQERMILATLVNHPDLLHDSLEALNEISLQSKELDTLLRVILNLAVTTPVLDTKDLQRHLIQSGYEVPLGQVLHPQVYRQASFAAPDATIADARAALDEILGQYRYRRERLAPDRVDAKEDLADDNNETKSNRLLELVREESGAGGLYE